MNTPAGLSRAAWAKSLCHHAAWSRARGPTWHEYANALEAQAAELTGGEIHPPTRWNDPDWLRRVREESNDKWRRNVNASSAPPSPPSNAAAKNSITPPR